MTLHTATDDEPQPWERQPGESRQAFAAFTEYRDQPPSKRARRRTGRISDWSVRWNWVSRSLAWDGEQDRVRREAMQESAKAMAQRQMRAAQLAQQKIVQWLIDLDPAQLTAAEAARWYEVAVRVERAAVGEPDRVDVTAHGQVVVAALSPEETLARLAAVQAQIGQLLGSNSP